MDWAAKYVGLPFAEHGRDESGVDCYGLVRLVWRNECGLELPSYVTEYDSTMDRESIAQALASFGHERDEWIRIPLGQEQPFDGVLLRMLGFPMHVGVVVTPGVMLHCEQGLDAALDRYNTMRWRNRLVGCWRHHSLQG